MELPKENTNDHEAEQLKILRTQRVRNALSARAAARTVSTSGRKPTISYEGAESPIGLGLTSKMRNKQANSEL